MADHTTLSGQHKARVLDVIDLTPSTYLLRLERNGLDFSPGQCVLLGMPGSNEHREYSIYSATNEAHLDVLIKEIADGHVSRRLKRCVAGDALTVEGPIGYFTLEARELPRRDYLFIASGTGVAPFHSMACSYADLNYRLLHGVRYRTEAYGRTAYGVDRYTLCTSRDGSGDYHGRVTDYLREHPVDARTLCYLCGNVRMIDDVYEILESQHVPADNIRAEVYF